VETGPPKPILPSFKKTEETSARDRRGFVVVYPTEGRRGKHPPSGRSGIESQGRLRGLAVVGLLARRYADPLVTDKDKVDRHSNSEESQDQGNSDSQQPTAEPVGRP
jgi:hypothetical protein